MASKNLELYLVGKDLSASKAVKSLGGELDKTSVSGSKMGAALKVGLLAGAGAAVALGVSAVHMAMQFQDADTRLQSAVKNVGGSFDQLKPKVEDLDHRMAKLGFTGTEVESSLAGLVTATKNPAKALGLMGLAADIARGRNIDLASATNILVKVESGHVGSLGRLGIATKDATGKTLTQDEAVRKLTALYGGDAQASANTFAGKMRALKAQAEELTVKLGLALIPVVSALINVVMDVAGVFSGAIGWFEKNQAAVIGLAAALGTLLIPAMLSLISDAVEFVATNVEAAFLAAAEGVKAFATAATFADLAIAPLAIAIGAIGYLVVKSGQASKKAWDEGTKAADGYADSLATNKDSVDTMQQSLGRLQDKLAGQRAVVEGAIAAGNGLNGSLFQQIATLGEYDDRAKQQAVTVAQMADNQSTLAHQYGLSTAQVEVFAAVNNIDLSQSLDGVSAKFKQAWIATQATHKPMTQAQIDFKNVGNKAFTASEQVQALKAGFDELVGKSVDAHEATVTFYNDLATLTEKLKASKGSMDLSTQAGRDASSAFSTLAKDTGDVTAAQKAAGYSTNTMKASLDKEIAALEKAGGNSSYVRDEIARLKAAEDALYPSVVAVNNALNKVPSNPYSGVHVPGLASSGAGFARANSATGGLVTGDGTKTSDSVKMNLSRGEFVLQASAVDKLGLPYLRALNAGSVPQLRTAGIAAPGTAATVVQRSGDIHVHVYNAAVGSPQEIAKGLVREMNRELKRLSAKGYATNN